MKGTVVMRFIGNRQEPEPLIPERTEFGWPLVIDEAMLKDWNQYMLNQMAVMFDVSEFFLLKGSGKELACTALAKKECTSLVKI